MKEDYIRKIVKQMKICNNIPLLDLILKLLVKTNAGSKTTHLKEGSKNEQR